MHALHLHPVALHPSTHPQQIKQVAGEFQMATSGKAAMVGGMAVGHIAHLAGAAVGVLLVLLLARLPDTQE